MLTNKTLLAFHLSRICLSPTMLSRYQQTDWVPENSFSLSLTLDLDVFYGALISTPLLLTFSKGIKHCLLDNHKTRMVAWQLALLVLALSHSCLHFT